MMNTYCPFAKKIIVAILLLVQGSIRTQQNNVAKTDNLYTKALKLVATHRGPVIGINHPDVIASASRSGFETGQVVIASLLFI